MKMVPGGLLVLLWGDVLHFVVRGRQIDYDLYCFGDYY